MNKFIVFALLVVFVALNFIGGGNGEDEKRGRATAITDKAMGEVKKVANKGAKQVETLANGVTVQVERFTNPPAHQPGQRPIISSAIRGTGRLVRDITTETGRFIGNVTENVYNLGRNTAGAVIRAVRESANRIGNPRHLNKPPQQTDPVVESNSGSSDATADVDANQEAAASEENGQKPDELQRKD